jgi:hypothetical protein
MNIKSLRILYVLCALWALNPSVTEAQNTEGDTTTKAAVERNPNLKKTYQNRPTRTQSLQIGPLTTLASLLFGIGMNIEYQVEVADGVAISIEPWLLYMNRFILVDSDINLLIVATKIGMRFGFGKGLEGAYVRPALFPFGSIERSSADSFFAIGFMCDSGYQWIWSSGFALSFGGSLGAGFVMSGSDNPVVPLGGLDLKLGYAW